MMKSFLYSLFWVALFSGQSAFSSGKKSEQHSMPCPKNWHIYPEMECSDPGKKPGCKKPRPALICIPGKLPKLICEKPKVPVQVSICDDGK